MTRPSEDRENGSAKIVWSWGRRGGHTLEKEKFGCCFFMISIKNLNPNDYSYNRRINGLIGPEKENKTACRIGKEKQTLPRKASKILPGNWRVEKLLLRRNRSSKTSKNWWIVQERNPTTVSQLMTQIQESHNKVNSLSDARERCDPESVREQLWSDPRERSNLCCSDSHNFAALRFWNAAWYTKWHGYHKKRCWTTTCSRRTILYNLQQFKECGIFLSGIETWYYSNSTGKERVTWKKNRWIHQFLHTTPKVEVTW